MFGISRWSATDGAGEGLAAWERREEGGEHLWNGALLGLLYVCQKGRDGELILRGLESATLCLRK